MSENTRARKSGIGFAVERKLEDVSIYCYANLFCYAQIIIIFWIQDVDKRSCEQIRSGLWSGKEDGASKRHDPWPNKCFIPLNIKNTKFIWRNVHINCCKIVDSRSKNPKYGRFNPNLGIWRNFVCCFPSKIKKKLSFSTRFL